MPEHFLQQLRTFVANVQQAGQDDQQLLARLQQLTDQLAPTFDLQGCAHQSELVQECGRLMVALSSQMQHWQAAWQAAQPMLQMSHAFADRFVLLVFGKVNAGKSSLINYLADTLSSALQVTPQPFQLQHGQQVPLTGKLTEGATETTSQIQGVLIGPHLVILDTPGLHSVTPENAALTRRYTDAADAVIWLTPSTNPGLVHELDALRQEIMLGKPVLPVISRSDTTDESIDPLSGALQSCYVPKDQARRHAQEQDVLARASQHLAAHQHGQQVPQQTAQLWSPVSVSVHCARQDPASDHGMPALYQALDQLLQRATRDKGQKWARQQAGFWQREVQPRLQQLPLRFTALSQQVDNLQRQLPAIRQHCQLEMAAQLTADWPALVAKHGQSGDEQALLRSYQQRFRQVADTTLTSALTSFFASLPRADSLLEAGAMGRYEEMLVSYQIPIGHARQRRSRLFGSLIGGTLGLLGGPVGGLAGAALGGLLAGALSDAPGYHDETVSIGLDSSGVLQHGIAAIEQDVASVVERLFSDLAHRYLQPVAAYCQHATTALQGFDIETDQLVSANHGSHLQ